MLLSIISPTYNEADNILKFVNLIELTLKKYDYEIIFVDDNSSDKTYEIKKNLSSKKPNVRCLRRIGRRGLSSAVIEGCLSSSSDLLLIMDADLQHDEKKIPLMMSLFNTIIKKKPLIGSVSLALEIVLANKLAIFDKAFLYLVKPSTFL